MNYMKEVWNLAKPSIFSRDYEKRMKRRKRRITIGIILILLVVVVPESVASFVTPASSPTIEVDSGCASVASDSV